MCGPMTLIALLIIAFLSFVISAFIVAATGADFASTFAGTFIVLTIALLVLYATTR